MSNHPQPEPSHDLIFPKFYHGTKAKLKPGDLIKPDKHSNYGKRKKTAFVYLTGTISAAAWGAELASGDGPGRIYIVEPTGLIDDDSNLTNKNFPGNPTQSYRTLDPLRVVGEVTHWQGLSLGELKAMKQHLQQLKEPDIEAIEE